MSVFGFKVNISNIVERQFNTNYNIYSFIEFEIKGNNNV